MRVAVLSVSAVRENGLWVYRKPEEYKDNEAHVVICPSNAMSRSQYKKAASKLAKHAQLLPTG